jgi:iron complex outermembrane receptor protein
VVEVKRDYDLTLPSFNLAADLTDTFVARVSAAKTIARPGIGSLSPGGDVSVQGANRSFSSGNPYLNPTQSKNLDVSLEWYPSSRHDVRRRLLLQEDRHLRGHPERAARLQHPGPAGLADRRHRRHAGHAVPGLQADQHQGRRPEGLRAELQQPFTFLPGWLSHFGVIANYTYVDSKIEYPTSSTAGAPVVINDLIGLSKNAANATLYYETDQWSVRGSLAYRDGYLTQVPGSDGNTVQGTNETLNVDMQASWNIRENLKLSVEGVNLTDEFNDQYVGDSNRLNVYTHSGRQFIVGLRYNF